MPTATTASCTFMRMTAGHRHSTWHGLTTSRRVFGGLGGGRTFEGRARLSCSEQDPSFPALTCNTGTALFYQLGWQSG